MRHQKFLYQRKLLISATLWIRGQVSSENDEIDISNASNAPVLHSPKTAIRIDTADKPRPAIRPAIIHQEAPLGWPLHST
jgi:hypothetical protein